MTCPTFRLHPAIVAHAAATVAAMMPGRFLLGLGSGEALNEHVLGQRWPPVALRQAMLAEAVEVIRARWQGTPVTARGRFYTVEDARLYTRPATPPPILIAAGGPRAAGLAGRLADGLVATAPDPALVRAFEEAGGRAKPRYAELTVCWGPDEGAARRTAHRLWPIAALPGALLSELPRPAHVEQAARLVDEAAVARVVVCGPDPAPDLEALARHARAGFDHVGLHQVGPDQEGFLDFCARELVRRVGAARTRAA